VAKKIRNTTVKKFTLGGRIILEMSVVFSGIKGITLTLRNTKFEHRIHKRLPPVPIMSQINLVH